MAERLKAGDCKSPLARVRRFKSVSVHIMKNGAYDLIVAPEWYPGKLYRGRYCYLYVFVYWFYHRVLPKRGEVIHHKNENKRDNRIRNLELMTAVEHSAHHLGRAQRGHKSKTTSCLRLDKDVADILKSLKPTKLRSRCQICSKTINVRNKVCSKACQLALNNRKYKMSDLKSDKSDSELARLYSVSPNAIRKKRKSLGLLKLSQGLRSNQVTRT